MPVLLRLVGAQRAALSLIDFAGRCEPFARLYASQRPCRQPGAAVAFVTTYENKPRRGEQNLGVRGVSGSESRSKDAGDDDAQNTST